MDLSDNCNSSIFELVGKLAVALSQDEHGQVQTAAVQKRRMQIFHTLLGASTATPEPPPCCYTELSRQITACRPAIKKSKTLRTRHERLQQLQQLLEQERSLCETKLGNGMAFLLLRISEEDIPAADMAKSIALPESTLLNPVPFKLHKQTNNNALKRLHKVLHPETKLLMSVEQQSLAMQPVNTYFRKKSPIVLNSTLMNSLNYEQRACRSFMDSIARIHEPKEPIEYIKPRLPRVKLPPANTAQEDCQQLPQSDVPALSDDKLCISDLKLTHVLRKCADEPNAKSFELKIIKQCDLIKYLKLCLTGIESEFVYSLNGLFKFRADLKVEGLMAEVLASFVKHFLLGGDCYRRLCVCSKWPSDSILPLSHERPLNRSMRKAIKDMLEIVREHYISLQATQLSELYQSARPAMQLMQELDYMLTSACKLNLADGISGANLLSYVWCEIDACVNSAYSELLLYFLRRLCETYYMQLQKWIYYGVLEGQYNELFICNSAIEYDELTKEFFDKGFVLCADVVPGFLVGCEQDILQCGRYNLLLKLYKTQHAIFAVKYPDVSVCLCEEEVTIMRNKLELHYSQILQEFAPCSIQQVYEERTFQKNRFKNRMREVTQTYLTAWADEQKAQLAKVNAQKKLMYEKLNAYMEEEKQRKLANQQLEIVHELEFQKECARLEEQRLEREKTELLKRIRTCQEKLDADVTESECSPNSSSSVQTFVTCEDDSADAAVEPTTVLSTSSLSVQLKRSHSDMLNSNEQQPFAVEPTTVPSTSSLSVQLKRSHSDMLNSNEEQPFAMAASEMARNRMRVLSSEVFDAHTAPVVHKVNENILTDAEQNKQRVLNCTLFIDHLPPDVNLNTLPSDDKHISDVQRNRQRMMQHDSFVAYNSNEDVNTQRITYQINEDSDLARNRRRVLEGEYDMYVAKTLRLPVQLDKLHVEDATTTAGTPMSISSDVEPFNTVQAEHQDAENNNAGKSVKFLDKTQANSAVGAARPCEEVLSEPNVEATPQSTGKTTQLHDVPAPQLHVEVAAQSNVETPAHSDVVSITLPAVELVPEANAEKTFEILPQLIDLNIETAVELNQEPTVLQTVAKPALESAAVPTQSDSALSHQTNVGNVKNWKLELAMESAFRPTSKANIEAALKTFYGTDVLSDLNAAPQQEAETATPSNDAPAEPSRTGLLTTLPLAKQGNTVWPCRKAHNPYMIKRYLQQSIMLPLNVHFSLLRNEVLRIFLQDLRIYEQLRQLRNYFFLLNGEFCTLLSNGILAHIESDKDPQSLLQKGVLDAILDNSLVSSSADCVAFAQNLTLHCTSIPETVDLMSLNALSIFTLHCKIDWPLNLVISPKAMAKYAEIFSYLLKLRHMAFILERSFVYLQEVSKQHGSGLRSSSQYRHLQLMRHKLSHFVTTLQNHLTANALQSSWQAFKQNLISVNSVEGLYKQHVAYLKRITFLMLLNRKSAKFQEMIDKILVVILHFCKVLHSQTFVLIGDQFVHPRYKNLVLVEQEFENCMSYLIYLCKKVADCGYQEEIRDLMLIINFNNYIT